MTFAMSAAALTVLSLLIGFLVHAALLGPEYAKLASLFRTPADAEGHFPYMILAHVFIGIGMTWVYRRGREAKPWLAQGVRFGLALSVLIVVPMYLIYFAVQPMPAVLVAKQIVFDTVGYIVLGIVAAWINQRDLAPAV
jgi:predicted membrane channel-forming protein YqfA (hemolysin III family)